MPLHEGIQRVVRTIVGSVDVDVAPAEAWSRWADIESFPGFMEAVAAVRRLDDRSSHWVVVVNGERREFGAVITEQVPGNRFVWESAGPPPHQGMVSFRPLAGGRTRVTVHLDWEPAGLFDRLGDRLGLVRRQLGCELEAFALRLGSRAGPPTEDRPAAGRGAIGAFAGAPTSPADTVVDAARAGAVDDGRGRTADSPTEIPKRGWLDILKRTVAQLKADNIPIVAAGVAFFVFLALVPALLAVASVYGLVADPADVGEQLGPSLTALPADARELILTQLRDITRQPEAGLGIGLAVSLVAALLSASKGMVSLVAALNIAYDEDETRTFLRLRALAVAVTLAMTVAAGAGVGGMVLAGNVAEHLGPAGEVALSILRWPVLGTLVVLGLAALYRYAPARDNPRWRWVTPGALVATVLWLVGSVGFSVYASVFGDYQKTYGGLSAVVVLLLWLYVTAYIIVFGAELDAETERQTARDSTVGSTKPLGQRRAYAADTVGPPAD